MTAKSTALLRVKLNQSRVKIQFQIFQKISTLQNSYDVLLKDNGIPKTSESDALR